MELHTGYTTGGMLRGIRIRSEHQHDFPSVLVGFGGGMLLSSMAVREDCLITLQKIIMKADYVEGEI